MYNYLFQKTQYDVVNVTSTYTLLLDRRRAGAGTVGGLALVRLIRQLHTAHAAPAGAEHPSTVHWR